MNKLNQWLFFMTLSGAMASCQPKCRIEPPPAVVGTNKEIQAKAAADALSASVSKLEAGGSYKNAVNKTYGAVSEADTAFYLLLQAYNCESERGNREGAVELLRLARQELARRNRVAAPPPVVAGTSTKLTATEKRILKQSPLKEEIARKLAAPAAAEPPPAARPSPTP